MSRVVVQAPMSGGPSTPALAAAVSNAGGLGFLAAGYRTAAQLAEDLAETRRLTDQLFGVNLFAHRSEPVDVSATAEAWGLDPSNARWSDDEYDAKLALLEQEPPAVLSFTFGLPDPLPRFTETWVTVTTVAEARAAEHADALVLQGSEAGGHRGTWVDTDEREDIGTLALIALARSVTSKPLVAAGGIADGAGVAAVLAAGASRAMLGSAFLLCPEAGTAPAYREALVRSGRTGLTRAFSGRLARGIVNRWQAEHADAPLAYPEIHYLTSPMRAEARSSGDTDAFNLWAGQAHSTARALPAGELVRLLLEEAHEALELARHRLDR